MSADYFADLPADERAAFSALARKYLGRPTVSNRQAALELLALQRLDIAVTEAHADWLAKAKATVEQQGREWTRENLLWYAARGEEE